MTRVRRALPRSRAPGRGSPARTATTVSVTSMPASTSRPSTRPLSDSSIGITTTAVSPTPFPRGWSNPEDNQDGYVLVRRDAPGIFVFSDVLPHAQGMDPVTKHCRIEPARGIGSSASAVFTTGSAHCPGCGYRTIRRTSRSAASPGIRWTFQSTRHGIKRADGPTRNLASPCSSTRKRRPTKASTGASMVRVTCDSSSASLAPDRALLVDIEAQDKATWDALLNEAAQIVHTFDFRH